MTLRERLQEVQKTTAVFPDPARAPVHDESAYQKLKSEIHRKLLDRVDLEVMASLSQDKLREELRILVERLLAEEHIAINTNERKQMVKDIQDEILGLGPLEPLLSDPTISDILINTHRQVYVERYGKLELTNLRFASPEHLLKIIDKIVSRVGRRIDESSPMVDARLPDGSRVNAVIPPLALDGPLVSIRRFSVVPLKMEDLLKLKTLTPEMADLCAGMVKARLNILISGGTGTGKTTTLNVLSGYIPPAERIVTIEDAAELQLQQPHVVRLETRPANIEGKGEVTQRSLVRNALRMRPDRIVLGEVRSAEALDMLQAMNTGHDGSMTTVHANSPRDALTRLENMIGMAGLVLPPKAMRQQISAAINVVLQIARQSDGKRRMVSIQELTGMEGDIVTMHEIFAFNQTGVDEKGNVRGHFRATGIRPKFMSRLQAHGVKLNETLFDPARTYE
ncbi:MAG: CpaF family protein [Burkholderiales bacterium]